METPPEHLQLAHPSGRTQICLIISGGKNLKRNIMKSKRVHGMGPLLLLQTWIIG